MTGPEVVRGADADTPLLQDAAGSIVVVGHHEGVDWVDALGPENTHMLAISERLGWRVRQVWVSTEGDLASLHPVDHAATAAP